GNGSGNSAEWTGGSGQWTGDSGQGQATEKPMDCGPWDMFSSVNGWRDGVRVRGEVANDSRGDTGGDNVIGNRLGHDGASTDDRTGADVGEYDGIGSQPGARADPCPAELLGVVLMRSFAIAATVLLAA